MHRVHFIATRAAIHNVLAVWMLSVRSLWMHHVCALVNIIFVTWTSARICVTSNRINWICLEPIWDTYSDWVGHCPYNGWLYIRILFNMGTLCIWCNCSMLTSEVQAAYGNICRLNLTFKMFSYRAGRLQTKRVRSNFIWKHTNVHKPIATCAVCTLTSNDEQAYSNVCRLYLYFELRTSLQQHVHIVFYIRSMNKPMGACADCILSLKRARLWEIIHIVFEFWKY